MSEPALFQAIPAARARVPWMRVGCFPTPVERVDGLVPDGVELWVKREDRSGDLYGGNKVRKLEFLFAAARAHGRTRLCTFGGWGAHHVVATSVYGPRHGFRVDAAVVPQPLDDHVREQLIVDHAAGARLLPVSGYLGVLPLWARAHMDPDAAWLSGGGSSPVGTLGWVSAGFELLAQVRSGEMPPIDVVYVALGSCGTVAGLSWSLWATRPVEIVAVPVVGNARWGAWRTRQLVRGVERILAPLAGRARAGEPPRLRLATEFGGHYGEASEASRGAVVASADVGLALDPIYTGKVMATLLADAHAGRLRGRRVLFLHSHNTVDLRPLVERQAGLETLTEALRRRVV
jgi:1-aminocyclopropane-1-carboxylate deaminase/D-cysteine desulfhydrase-like pyridoxal-dependent ACC family enzyme